MLDKGFEVGAYWSAVAGTQSDEMRTPSLSLIRSISGVPAGLNFQSSLDVAFPGRGAIVTNPGDPE
jgi:hypothetical protein